MRKRSGGWAAAGCALAGLLAGAALQAREPTLAAWAAYAAWAVAGGLATMLLLFLRPAGWRAWPAFAAAVALGFGTAGWRAAAFDAQRLAAALEGRDVVLTGVIAAMPQRTELGVNFRFEVLDATLADQPVRVPRMVSLGWFGGAWAPDETRWEVRRTPVELHAGDRWRFTARLKAPHGAVNPHGFDAELALWERGVQATGYVRAGPRDAAPQRLGASSAYPVEQVRQRVRDSILARIEERRASGVIAALVTGDQAAVERADWDVFRATGVAHLMSISGLHVTMFAWVAAALVGALWRRSARACLAVPAQHAGSFGGLLLATAYAAFSGWGVPAQRTLWMLLAVTLLRWAGCRWPWPCTWLLAAAVVVAIDPLALQQAGFWLSFVAVGVLFASDPPNLHGQGPAGWRARGLRMLREQGVVTIALAPLSLLLFGQVSVVGVIANLLAIPWVTLVVTPLALGGVAVPPLWQAAAAAVQALMAVLDAMAAWPLATVEVAAPPLWAGIAGVLGGLLLVMPLPRSLRLLAAPLLLPVALWQPERPPPGEFELLAADVGQGNAVIVRTQAHTLVYDTGPRYGAESDAGHRVLVPLLRAHGERPDVVVLSHRDTDHAGGAAALLRAHPGARLVSSIEPDHELQALRPAQRCEAGQAWTWDGVRFEVLHPAAGDYAGTPRPNALSCVLRVGPPGRAVLLAGDIEHAQEARLATADVRAAVLLVPHHGSKTSSSAVFLDAVQPRLALVQAGYRNRFGHPAAPVLARYEERGIAVVATPRCGAVHWRSRQPLAFECERELQRRYWRHAVP